VEGHQLRVAERVLTPIDVRSWKAPRKEGQPPGGEHPSSLARPGEQASLLVREDWGIVADSKEGIGAEDRTRTGDLLLGKYLGLCAVASRLAAEQKLSS